MNKDYAAVNEYYDENQKYEFRMVHFLNRQRPMSMVDAGYVFEINTVGKYDKHDIDFVKISPDRTKKILATIEFEYAAKQSHWDLEIPRDKWSGINLMDRKLYGESFRFFMKSSPTFNSFFVIDCEDNFVQKNGRHQTTNHSLGFETNDTIYKLPFNFVDENTYREDKVIKVLINKNICICENDPTYNIFYKYISRRLNLKF
jgi:hypothetical protein